MSFNITSTVEFIFFFCLQLFYNNFSDSFHHRSINPSCKSQSYLLYHQILIWKRGRTYCCCFWWSKILSRTWEFRSYFPQIISSSSLVLLVFLYEKAQNIHGTGTLNLPFLDNWVKVSKCIKVGVIDGKTDSGTAKIIVFKLSLPHKWKSVLNNMNSIISMKNFFLQNDCFPERRKHMDFKTTFGTKLLKADIYLRMAWAKLYI